MREAASIIGFIIGLIALVPGLYLLGSGLFGVILFFPYPSTKKTYSSGAGTTFLICLGFIAFSIPIILGGSLSLLGGLLAKNEAGWSSLILSGTGIILVIISCVISATSGPNELILALFIWGELGLLASILALASLVTASLGLILILVLLSGVLIGTFIWEVVIVRQIDQRQALRNAKLINHQPIGIHRSETIQRKALEDLKFKKYRMPSSIGSTPPTTRAVVRSLASGQTKPSATVKYVNPKDLNPRSTDETKQPPKRNRFNFWKRR
jgi:hypothetical protein